MEGKQSRHKCTWGQPWRFTSKWLSTGKFTLSSLWVHERWAEVLCSADLSTPCWTDRQNLSQSTINALSQKWCIAPLFTLWSHCDPTRGNKEVPTCTHPDNGDPDIFVEQHRWLAASKKVILSFHRGPEDTCSQQGMVVNTRNIPMITVLGR